MPKARDFNQPLLVLDAINNSIRLVDDFTRVWFSKFGNDATQFREGGEQPGLGNQFAPETFRFKMLTFGALPGKRQVALAWLVPVPLPEIIAVTCVPCPEASCSSPAFALTKFSLPTTPLDAESFRSQC